MEIACNNGLLSLILAKKLKNLENINGFDKDMHNVQETLNLFKNT